MAQDFKFFASYLDAASELSEKDCKDFVYAIVQYGINGVELPIKKSMKPMWILVKPTLDSSRKLHECGKNGGRPKKPPFQDSKSPLSENEKATSKAPLPMDKDKEKEYGLKKECEKEKEPAKRFKAPTVEQAKEYFANQGYMESEAERFVDHFTANGWKVGKSPMKDWKAAARNWMRNVKDWNGGYQQTMAELPDEGDFLR